MNSNDSKLEITDIRFNKDIEIIEILVNNRYWWGDQQFTERVMDCVKDNFEDLNKRVLRRHYRKATGRKHN